MPIHATGYHPLRPSPQGGINVSGARQSVRAGHRPAPFDDGLVRHEHRSKITHATRSAGPELAAGDLFSADAESMRSGSRRPPPEATALARRLVIVHVCTSLPTPRKPPNYPPFLRSRSLLSKWRSRLEPENFPQEFPLKLRRREADSESTTEGGNRGRSPAQQAPTFRSRDIRRRSAS